MIRWGAGRVARWLRRRDLGGLGPGCVPRCAQRRVDALVRLEAIRDGRYPAWCVLYAVPPLLRSLLCASPSTT